MTDILLERVDILTVKARVGDLVVPCLGSPHHPCLYSVLVLLPRVRAPVGILPHVGAVQLVPLLVVPEGALVSPPLGYSLKLRAPYLYNAVQ